MRHERESPKGKLSRIEENSSSEEEQDEDDIFLHDLERENKMLEGVLRDLQGVIKKEKREYSFEKSPKDKHHFTSVRPTVHQSPKGKSTSQPRESRIPRVRGSLDARPPVKKHNFNLSNERSATPKERSHSARRPYESQTQSSMNRNYFNVRSSKEGNIDEEHESMEMQPPVPHSHERDSTTEGNKDVEKDEKIR